MLNFDVFYSNNTIGLAVDAHILGDAFIQAGHSCRLVAIPYELFIYSEAENTLKYSLPEIRSNSHCVFLESIFEHGLLKKYKSSIFIPNPECFVRRDFLKAQKVNFFWHKTKMSLNLLKPLYQNSSHIFTDFTSYALNACQPLSYENIVHFRGKSGQRHTKELLDVWARHPEWPQLRVQLYGPDCPFEFHNWLKFNNIFIYLGRMENDQYLKEVSNGGIQLCLSSKEGFGHYINEAKSLGALVITLDAPPMNELISPEMGILVPYINSEPINSGWSYSTNAELIESAVVEVLSMPLSKRKKIGSLAKNDFAIRHNQFFSTIQNITSQLRL